MGLGMQRGKKTGRNGGSQPSGSLTDIVTWEEVETGLALCMMASFSAPQRVAAGGWAGLFSLLLKRQAQNI